MDFDWDIYNIEHIARHKVEPDEVEEAATDPAAIEIAAHRGPLGQPRYGLIGASEMGRILVIFYEYRNKKIRVVTVRQPTSKETSLYYAEEDV